MACFCGCETYVKNEDGFKIACVKCEHGLKIMMTHLEMLQERMNHKVRNVMQILDKILFSNNFN